MVGNLTLTVYFFTTHTYVSGIINQFNFCSVCYYFYIFNAVLDLFYFWCLVCIFGNWLYFNGRPWWERRFICFCSRFCYMYYISSFRSNKQVCSYDIHFFFQKIIETGHSVRNCKFLYNCIFHEYLMTVNWNTIFQKSSLNSFL